MHSTVPDVPGFIFLDAGLLDAEHFVGWCVYAFTE